MRQSIFLILMLLMSVVSTVAQDSNQQECVTDFDSETDYFPDKVEVNHAALFQVEYYNNYKVVRTQADAEYFTPISANEVYVLVQCGTTAPESTGDLSDATVIEVPVQRVSTGNNEEVAALIELGLADRIVSLGTPTNSADAWHPLIKEMIDSGIPVTGTSFSINLETVVVQEPDLLILLTWIGNQQENLEIARELGIPTVGHHVWLEPTPLGRAEWLKFFALFFNQEAEANAVYGDIEQRYTEIRNLTTEQDEKPSAFFAQVGETNSVSQNDFQAQLIVDAGGINVLADAEAPAYPTPLSLETLTTLAGDASYWFTSSDTQLEAVSSNVFAAINLGQVYATTNALPLSGHSYFGDAIFRADLLLQDFAAVLHPELFPDYELIWLKPLAVEQS